jgi:hypothetical protein
VGAEPGARPGGRGALRGRGPGRGGAGLEITLALPPGLSAEAARAAADEVAGRLAADELVTERVTAVRLTLTNLPRQHA